MSILQVDNIIGYTTPTVTIDGDIVITGIISGSTSFNFSGNTSGNPISDIWVSGDVHASTYYGDGSNLTGITGGGGVTEVTYTELVDLITGGTLNVGSYYKIIDFQTCYDQPDFDYNGNAITSVTTYHTSDIDPIIVLATSENTLSPDAYQPSYPNDKIKYDYSFSVTELTGEPIKGRITERIDEFGNRTDYDHRTILFKRYVSYFDIDELNGRIISMNDGSVIGLNTTFTTDLSVGSTIMIYNGGEPKLYEVTEILSNSAMTVNGWTYYNFSDTVGFYCKIMAPSISQEDGTLYYFNDVSNGGGNNIGDGGDDMYDTGNILNTNLYGYIPYTHSQMTNPPVPDYDPAEYNQFTYDGIINSGDTYFGVGSNYFTNLYPGLFVMVAYDVAIDNFYTDGDLGADGGGSYDEYYNTLSGYTIFGKFVYNAGNDPSVTHLMIVNSTDPSITHTYNTNTNSDYDSIYNLSAVTQVHYLLFALSKGIKPTVTQIENLVNSYLSTIDSGNINNTLSNLNINFSAITNNLPNPNFISTSLNYKQTNLTGDTENYREFLTFNYTSNFVLNNYIGDFANLKDWEESEFILSNNVFINGDTVSNKFGNACFNNTLYDNCRYNFIGDYFYNNIITNSFNENSIGTFFNRNNITSNFYDNRIGNDFNNNTIMGDSFYRNNIGNDFNDNIQINNDFQNNEIGNQYQNNFIYDDFYKNDIGNGFNENRIYRNFYGNLIGNGFNNNKIYIQFYENKIGDKFGGNNEIGVSTNIGGGEFRHNDIGSNFYDNTCIGTFSYNRIGSYFYNNNIDYGFGFGYNASQGNTIGNYFYGNTIGEYFYNNTIADGFYNNQIGNYFQMNYIKINELNSVNFIENYGNITGFTYSTGDVNNLGVNTYTNLQGATNGDGAGASFDISVNTLVNSVTLNQSGVEYQINDTITILGSQIGGIDGQDDVVITVTSVSQIPSVYEIYTCDIFKRSDNTKRLSYYDENDILTIKDITT